ncbi:single-stranded-DNA-specific exonuclease RecJ [Candidatus Roizmanbacteria bacterium]|nr:MAG: single-stranded-DNA-specific exonuclease RecJ [Candidatus Roizmanbacteria bacterium]
MKIQVKHTIKPGEKLQPQEIVDIILKTRNINDKETFLNPPSPLKFTLKDFGFTKRQIDHAMDLLQQIFDKKQTIVVYTDYDADGITGGSVLWETLHTIGFNAMPYVPHRQHEGYGFSKIGIDNVKKEFDPALIISVDHGITGVEQVSYAKSIGIPVIITDHHHKQEKIPEDAEEIFHIPALSGSGTAYYFAKEVFLHFKNQISETKVKELKRHFETDYLSLATIGTVADLVPLVGPSRSVVRAGLAAFPHVRRHGIRQICKQAEIDGKIISPYEIGFIIAPRINAVGRLEHAIDALRLLCTTSEERAAALASKVGEMNTTRQDLVKKQVEEAVVQVQKMKELPKLLILYSDHWHEGVIGLIASSILEKYYRPTIVMTRGDGFYKASVRSIPGFHITEFLGGLQEYLKGYGGHAAAAGFTLPAENLDIFMKKAIDKASKQLSDDDLERIIQADMQIPLSNLSVRLSRLIDTLAPFGVGNPKPVFMSDAELLHAKILGKNRDHLKLSVKQPDMRSVPIDMIAFGQASIFPELSKGQTVKVVYQLDINKWNGNEDLQGVVQKIIL